MSDNFGSVLSIPEALAKNPSMFLRHITYNLQALVKTIPALVSPTNFPMDNMSIGAMALLIVGLLSSYLSNVRKNFPDYLAY